MENWENGVGGRQFSDAVQEADHALKRVTRIVSFEFSFSLSGFVPLAVDLTNVALAIGNYYPAAWFTGEHGQRRQS